jgi:hypothetical protein
MDTKTKDYLFDVLCAVDNNLHVAMLRSQYANNKDEQVKCAEMIQRNDMAMKVLVGGVSVTYH